MYVDGLLFIVGQINLVELTVAALELEEEVAEEKKEDENKEKEER